MIASPDIEQMDLAGLRKRQLERLQSQLRWAQEKSRYYQQAFAQAGVSWKDLRTLEDLQRFPTLDAVTMRQIEAMDVLTLPLSQILRCSYVGAEMHHVMKLYTAGDVAKNVEMMMRVLQAVGVNRTTIVALPLRDMDSRGMDIQYALENLGATVVELGPQQLQQEIFERIGIDMLVTTPQLVMQLIIQIQAAGRDLSDSVIQKVLCLNDTSIQNPMQRHIENRLQAHVYNLYAPPELGMAGMLYPCESRQGQHIQEDYFYPEILAFHSEKEVETPGQMGELVVTTLAAEAMPLIRYRTGQAVRLEEEPCTCGRTFRRILTPMLM